MSTFMIPNNFSSKDIQSRNCSWKKNANESLYISINTFNMTICCLFIKWVYKFVHYSCIFLFVYCTMLSLILSLVMKMDFKQTSSTLRTRLIFVHIISSSFMDLLIFICFPFHFYLFLGVSIFKTTLCL